MNTSTHRVNLQYGFSLVELMVVLAIASIITVLAVPSFQDTIERQKLSAASSDLYASVAMTRNEAIRRGGRVDLKAISDNWNNGWEITIPTGDNTSEQIYTHGPVPTGIAIAVPDFGTSLSYNGTGRTRTDDNSQVPATGVWIIKVNRAGSPHKRLLQINTIGRPLLCNPAVDTTCV